MRNANLILTCILTVVFAAMTGCMDPATRAQIAQVKNQAAIDAARSKAAADAAAAKAKEASDAVVEEAKTNPIRHPIAFANLIVSQIRPWFVGIGTICTVLTFFGIGAMIAANAAVPFFGGIVGGIAKVATLILATTSVGCWVTLWIAPLFFIFMFVVVIGGVVWVVVYLKKHDWKIKTLFAKHEENAEKLDENSAKLATHEAAITKVAGVSPELLAQPSITINTPGGVNAPIAG